MDTNCHVNPECLSETLEVSNAAWISVQKRNGLAIARVAYLAL
jgi:hypothetical protein